jgi:hypothetical protein
MSTLYQYECVDQTFAEFLRDPSISNGAGRKKRKIWRNSFAFECLTLRISENAAQLSVAQPLLDGLATHLSAMLIASNNASNAFSDSASSAAASAASSALCTWRKNAFFLQIFLFFLQIFLIF